MRRALTALLALIALAFAVMPSVLLMPRGALAEETKEVAEFYGVIGKRMPVYRSDSENASKLGTAESGTVVDVYKKGRTWTSIDFEG